MSFKTPVKNNVGQQDKGLVVGILGLQGAFLNHQDRLKILNVESSIVRKPEDLGGIHGLLIPGGESTVMSKMLDSSGLREPVTELVNKGLPAFGTCAGLIMLSDVVLDGITGQRSIGGLNMRIRRNGDGSQVASHEGQVQLANQSPDHFPDQTPDQAASGAFPGIFIRPPVIEEVGDGVEVFAWSSDGLGQSRPVGVRKGAIMATSFHPELTNDLRVHRLFVQSLQG